MPRRPTRRVDVKATGANVAHPVHHPHVRQYCWAAGTQRVTSHRPHDGTSPHALHHLHVFYGVHDTLSTYRSYHLCSSFSPSLSTDAHAICKSRTFVLMTTLRRSSVKVWVLSAFVVCLS